jgi:hypothetical protein
LKRARVEALFLVLINVGADTQCHHQPQTTIKTSRPYAGDVIDPNPK